VAKQDLTPDFLASGAPALSGPATISEAFPLSLSWTAVAHATRYELQQNWNGQGWEAAYSGAELSFSTITFAGNWTFRVRACSAAGCGPYSANRTVVVQPSTD
jgi:hypothetical protein